MTFNKGIVEAIGTELYSLVENLSDAQRRNLKQIMSQLWKEARRGFDNVEVVYNLSKKSDLLGRKESSMVKLFLYLTLIEGPAVCLIDILVILLILNGYELKFSCKKEIAKPTVEDMKKVSLGRKLTFLKSNGFPYIPIVIDRELRNSIAHHDFILGDRGEIIINDKQVDIDTKIQEIFRLGKILSNFYDLIILKERPEDEFIEVLCSILDK